MVRANSVRGSRSSITLPPEGCGSKSIPRRRPELSRLRRWRNRKVPFNMMGQRFHRPGGDGCKPQREWSISRTGVTRGLRTGEGQLRKNGRARKTMPRPALVRLRRRAPKCRSSIQADSVRRAHSTSHRSRDPSGNRKLQNVMSLLASGRDDDMENAAL